MTGGTENFNYRASVNYRDANGVVKDNTNKRMQARSPLRKRDLIIILPLIIT